MSNSCFLSKGVMGFVFLNTNININHCLLHTCRQIHKNKTDPRGYKYQGMFWQWLLCPLSLSLWSEHSCTPWQMRWSGGKKRNPKTEYSSHCNRFNLFCQNRLRYFASLLECCIFLLPPSLISLLPLPFSHYCNMALSISLSVWTALL